MSVWDPKSESHSRVETLECAWDRYFQPKLVPLLFEADHYRSLSVCPYDSSLAVAKTRDPSVLHFLQRRGVEQQMRVLSVNEDLLKEACKKCNDVNIQHYQCWYCGDVVCNSCSQSYWARDERVRTVYLRIGDFAMKRNWLNWSKLLKCYVSMFSLFAWELGPNFICLCLNKLS